jgi:tRNA-Thr(GGU) m(6)t(6)A37 methyltransferase TsaA
MTAFAFEPIGVCRSVYKEKFGIPRQPGLVPHARGWIELKKDARLRAAVQGLEQFSHLWIVWVFHEHGAKDWKPTVRPPRLGGAKKMGVLASRSPHRPNPIGLSAVKLESVRTNTKGQVVLEVSGLDLLDGTPVLDIKPYVPYTDALPRAQAGWAKDPIVRKRVRFSKKALQTLREIESDPEHRDFRKLVREFLALDPRPAFQQRRADPRDSKSLGMQFGAWVGDWDVKFEIIPQGFLVTHLVRR